MKKAVSKKCNAGFTLIELLIVIAIIGLLATVALPRFGGVTDQAKIAKIQADLHTVGVAAEMYRAEHGAYPADLEALVDASDDKKSYLQAVPKAPDDAQYNISALKTKGEVTCEYKGITYSSKGTNTGRSS